MIDSSDHLSKKTGLTCTVNISKAGAAFGAAGGSVTEVANGWYKVALNTTDTNTLGDLAYYITATGADDTDFVDQVAVNILGDTLPANLTQVNAHSVTDTTSGVPDVNVKNFGTTAVTGRDIAASVLLSTGTGTGQLDFTSGVVKANATQWLGGAIPAVNVTGVPLVDAKYLLGTVLATPATAGVLDVNVKNVNNVSASSVTTVSANQGTTQPVNFTGTAGSALVKSDMVDVAGAAVSTAAAQIGVNVVTSASADFKKNTALAKFEFPMTDSTTHAPKTGVTVTATRSIDGGAFASCANAVTELANGIYYIDLAATDLNGNVITLRFTGTASDDRLITIITHV